MTPDPLERLRSRSYPAWVLVKALTYAIAIWLILEFWGTPAWVFRYGAY